PTKANPTSMSLKPIDPVNAAGKSIDDYLEDATPGNTRQAYAADVRHYEVTWGGPLPATPEAVKAYLHHYAPHLAPSTLQRRLHGLSFWHQDYGFSDPTKDREVRKLLKGIRDNHHRPPVRAYPLGLNDIRQIVEWIDLRLAKSVNDDEEVSWSEQLRLHRDKALTLYAFWRALRAQSAVRLHAEHISSYDHHWEIYLPPDKTDKKRQGRQILLFPISKPEMEHLCPVRALQAWLNISQIQEGPL